MPAVRKGSSKRRSGAARAERVLGRQPQLGHGVDARVDDEPLAQRQLAAPREHPEAIAGVHGRRTVVVIPSLAALNGEAPRQPAERADAPESGEFAEVGGPVDLDLRVDEGQVGGEDVGDHHPGQGQELAVAHLQAQLHRLAQEGARLAQPPRVVETEQAQPAPGPAHKGDDEQEQAGGQQDGLVRRQPDQRHQQAEDEPGVAELGIHGHVDIAHPAPLPQDAAVDALLSLAAPLALTQALGGDFVGEETFVGSWSWVRD